MERWPGDDFPFLLAVVFRLFVVVLRAAVRLPTLPLRGSGLPRLTATHYPRGRSRLPPPLLAAGHGRG
jgi:hypothetical protein